MRCVKSTRLTNHMRTYSVKGSGVIVKTNLNLTINSRTAFYHRIVVKIFLFIALSTKLLAMSAKIKLNKTKL